MVDYEKYFHSYCNENDLAMSLSFDMPAGYETAYGTYDPTVNTVFINKNLLKELPEYEQLFYLFHELRHSFQYLFPEKINEAIRRSCQYVVMFDGTCFKLADDEWKECKLEGNEAYFSEMYLGQPYEVDANEFAYENVKKVLGESSELEALYGFWMPKREIENREFEELYSRIDERVR